MYVIVKVKIAVYDNVANVTFHSDFHFIFGENAAIVNDQITLRMVKTENGWKCVHEHHSPLKKYLRININTLCT